VADAVLIEAAHALGDLVLLAIELLLWWWLGTLWGSLKLMKVQPLTDHTLVGERKFVCLFV
jgi:hypothetical protein